MVRSLSTIISIVLISIITQSVLGSDGPELYVDQSRGSDQSVGSQASPVKTIYGAVRRLPKEITRDITIHLAAGKYKEIRGGGQSKKTLELNHPMPEGVKVRIVGYAVGDEKDISSKRVVLDWQPAEGDFLITVTQGHWTLENVQVGTRQPDQRCGVSVTGPGLIELHNVSIRIGGRKGPGICSKHGGRVYLYGSIGLNEDLSESGGNDENFCRIEAEYSGVVKFMQGKGATLTVGNGNLSSTYYGVIELGCEQASITSWNYQSNPIAVNNSGRVDLHNTTTQLCARNARNTPIGLEHDGHVLAEGAHIIINGQGNSNAIVLQKASSFFCNDVEIRGEVHHPLLAMSGSVMLVGINGDIGEVYATTCSSIIIEKCTGRLIGPFNKTKFGQIVLPEGTSPEVSDDNYGSEASTDSGYSTSLESIDITSLPALHAAVYGGHDGKVKQLIQDGADVNAKGSNGWTPLHMAAIGGHQLLAKFLLEQGADINARDEQTKTPAELAKICEHNGLAEFLASLEK